MASTPPASSPPDLRAGNGLSDPNLASEIGLYSGGGYSTIPDSFGSSQGTPLS